MVADAVNGYDSPEVRIRCSKAVFVLPAAEDGATSIAIDDRALDDLLDGIDVEQKVVVPLRPIDRSAGVTTSALAMDAATAQARINELEAALAAAHAELVAQLTAERDRLRESRDQLVLELELMRRRLFVAKAERVDTAQLEMEFAAKLAELDRLAGVVPPASDGERPPG